MQNANIKECHQKMEKTINVLKDELHSIRTGRASVGMMDNVMLDYYGTPTPISQMATVNAPEPRMVTVAPWDVSMLPQIEKAIRASSLGLNPGNDGKVIRVPVPALSEDRRKELVKVVKTMGEDCKIALRNIRRDENDKIKKQKKEGDLPEDIEKKLLDEIQKITDECVKTVDSVIQSKEDEIMEV